MAWMKVALLTLLLGFCAANTINRDTAFKSDSLERMIREVRTNCDSENDPLACMKLKVMQFLDTAVNKDNFKLTEDIEVRSNGPVEEARSQSDFLGFVENYVQSHDVTMKIPVVNSEVTISPRNINSDELDIKFKFLDSEERSVGEGRRRNKMKKIIVPIMVLILLKAMTVIPLALGILGLKAFNALQLGFMSFLVSAALAIFQICKKLALDPHHHAPHVVAPHVHWDARSLAPKEDDSHNLVYNAYV
ncbi:uncharacterized protein LOC119651680 [Hermetia illucens]|nr:uncharacterized protein LOC119651680 [Hermetia illucens]